MGSEQLLCQLSEVVLSQKLAVLATTGRTTPYANLIAFAASADLDRLWFATPRATRKYANLCADPHVALLIDSRANDIRDFERAVAATAMGQARELPDEELAEPKRVYLAKHPQLADFVASPSCAFFEVRVAKYVVVSSFQQVMEVAMP
jgi:nitroimidazol reductase NimA-like FMN-containing flavoprotein (pyridoxamine 5'-phosphate oxidase superfamily)